MLVDHQLERHVLGEQLRELSINVITRVHHSGWQLHSKRAVDTCRGERRIFDCLHQYTAPLGPPLDALVEEMPRQTVYFADVTAM